MAPAKLRVTSRASSRENKKSKRDRNKLSGSSLFPDHERIFILKRQERRSKGSVPVTTYYIPSYTCYLLYMKLVACLLVSGEHNRTVQFFFPSQVTEENLCDCAFLTMLPSDDLLNFGWTGNNHLPLTTLGKQFAFGIGEKG